MKPKPPPWRRVREQVGRMQLSALIAAKAAAYHITPKRESVYAR